MWTTEIAVDLKLNYARRIFIDISVLDFVLNQNQPSDSQLIDSQMRKSIFFLFFDCDSKNNHFYGANEPTIQLYKLYFDWFKIGINIITYYYTSTTNYGTDARTCEFNWNKIVLIEAIGCG